MLGAANVPGGIVPPEFYNQPGAMHGTILTPENRRIQPLRRLSLLCRPQMYCKNGRVKVQLALVKGKQLHDKRGTIRRREVDRKTRAAVRARSR